MYNILEKQSKYINMANLPTAHFASVNGSLWKKTIRDR